ncbi:MAG: amidohydrolase family protein [Gemmatimonadetes bacterium]|nr:amidohydrolase family protein [Gemmatimonadota bacterium]
MRSEVGGFARLAAAAAAVGFSACAADVPLVDLAIENVTVIDAENGARTARTVLVRGDTIIDVVAAGDAPNAEQVVDGTGRYLIPGLWDMHVHTTYDPALTPAMPGLFLRWGITSVRDTGGLLDRVLPVVEAWRAEGATAPRIFFAGPLLDGAKVVYDGNGRPEICTGNATVEDARAQVAELDAAGVDFIKIYEMVSPEVFDALVLAGEERGLPIDAHVPLSMRARDVAPRVNSMEHLRNVELDCSANPAALLAAREREFVRDPGEAGGDLRTRLQGLQRVPAVLAYDARECEQVFATMASTIQVPTLRLNSFALHPAFVDDGWFDAVAGAPAPIAESWDAAGRAWRADPQQQDTIFAGWSLRMVGEMHARGIPIGAGTDTPINYSLPGYALHTELEMLVRAGLAPLDAIRAATIRPAEFFGVQEMGRIEPGMRADLVLLDADPLADIRNTRRIAGVVTKGRMLAPEALEQLGR